MSSADAVAPEPGGAHGARFLSEIHEQPAALLRLLETSDEFERVARTIREREATTIRMVGMAPRTTQPPTASTRSGCSPGGPRSGTRSR